MQTWQRLRIGSKWCALSFGVLSLTAACSQEPSGASGATTVPQTGAGVGASAAAGAGTPTASAGKAAAGSGAVAPGIAGTSVSSGAGGARAGQAAAVAGSSAPIGSGTAGVAAATAGTMALAGAGTLPIAGGTAGAGGSAAAGAGGGLASGIDPLNPDWSKREDLGKGDGSDVITIGDSWMDYIGGGGGIQAGLDRAGTNYRHYGLSATTLLSGQIPGQYTRAKSANPKILTVIMTGGGNDVMFSGGCNTAEACEQSVAMIQAALDELWTEMAADGVKDVIYIQYSEDAGTAPQGTRPKETKPVPVCLTGKITCHALATTDLVMGQLVDGIHPAASANDRIAKALIAMMETRKMRR
jgi:hypothetical protein